MKNSMQSLKSMKNYMNHKLYKLPLGTSIKWWTYFGDRKLYKKGSMVKAANVYVTKEEMFVHAPSLLKAQALFETKLSTSMKAEKGLLYIWPAIEKENIKEVSYE